MENEKGYLVDPYRIFYLSDQRDEAFSGHYHDFNKCIYIIGGHLDYKIEGKNYQIKGPTLVLVREHAMHHVKVYGDCPYERMVLYLRSDFLREVSTRTTSLDQCFTTENPVLSLEPELNKDLIGVGESLIKVIQEPTFGSEVLTHANILLFLVYVNEMTGTQANQIISRMVTYDQRVELALAYIQDHLSDNLTVQDVADKTFISKFHLMRLFKQETGYSLHQYVQEKRLVLATKLIRDGMNYSEAANLAGFSDYSIFLRAFKKRYNQSPRNYFESK